jgi:hypothetical protein
MPVYCPAMSLVCMLVAMSLVPHEPGAAGCRGWPLLPPEEGTASAQLDPLVLQARSPAHWRGDMAAVWRAAACLCVRCRHWGHHCRCLPAPQVKGAQHTGGHSTRAAGWSRVCLKCTVPVPLAQLQPLGCTLRAVLCAGKACAEG